MAENKKSFIAYSDWYGMFNALPDEIAGKLIKHIFAYVNDQNPSSDDYIINALFEQVKSTLKRDLKKWENEREQRSKAGKKSAEMRGVNFNDRSTEFNERSTKINDRSISFNENQRKSTVSVNVNVSDNVSVSDKDIDVGAIAPAKNYKNQSELEFINEMRNFENLYSRDTLNAFYQYWGEKDAKGKMKYQTQKTWELEKRLARWLKKEKELNTKTGNGKKTFSDFASEVENLKQIM